MLHTFDQHQVKLFLYLDIFRGTCLNADIQMQMFKCRCLNADIQMQMFKCRCLNADIQIHISKGMFEYIFRRFSLFFISINIQP